MPFSARGSGGASLRAVTKNESIMSKYRAPQRQGMALVWVALTSIVFIVFLALAADTARVYLAAHQLQNAADAAALAGVYRVRHDPVGGEYPAHRAAHDTALINRV